MKSWLTRTWWLVVLLSLLVACGSTPQPTEPAPTQTPRIIVVTTTPCAETVAQVEASPVVVTVVVTATPAPTRGTVASPTAETTTEPGATEASTETPTAEATTAPARPSPTPQAAAIKYPAPVLLEPPNNRPVSWQSTVLLQWTSVGDLATDEYYHLHLDAYREATKEHWYGDYVFTKDTEFRVSGPFLAPFFQPQGEGHSVVYWWVRVVRKTGEDESGKPLGIDISLPSEKRTFITDPR